MRIRLCLLSLSVLVVVSFAAEGSAMQLTRDVKVISSAGARSLVDACAAWAEKNKQIVAIAILDWGGNLIESHAMEGAPMNAIDTALLKAKSALGKIRLALAAPDVGNEQDGAERRKLGSHLHERFPSTGRASHPDQWPAGRRDGRFQRRRREMRPGGDRRGL